MVAKKCVIVGRGALGVLYYEAISKVEHCDVAFAADPHRVQRYTNQPLVVRGQELKAKFYTPTQGDSKADIIIITTKWSGYGDALELIEPIVGNSTVILPLLNGLLPYERAVERYFPSRVKRGYYIGTTASRSGDKVWQEGLFTTVIEKCKELEELLQSAELNYRVEADMEACQWQKFVINIGFNQCSALDGGLSFGEIKGSAYHREIVRGLMVEAGSVAAGYGIEGAEGMAQRGMEFLEKLKDEDYSSMAQDIRAGRDPEVEIFGIDLLRRAARIGVETPINRKLIEQ